MRPRDVDLVIPLKTSTTVWPLQQLFHHLPAVSDGNMYSRWIHLPSSSRSISLSPSLSSFCLSSRFSLKLFFFIVSLPVFYHFSSLIFLLLSSFLFLFSFLSFVPLSSFLYDPSLSLSLWQPLAISLLLLPHCLLDDSGWSLRPCWIPPLSKSNGKSLKWHRVEKAA